MGPQIDPEFLALPASELAASALERASSLGADHAEFRLQRTRTATFHARDGRLLSARESEERGIALRVMHEGAWGFASTDVCAREAAGRLAERAVEVAALGAGLTGARAVLAPEPVHAGEVWVSSYATDPFDLPLRERSARLVDMSAALLAGVEHVDGHLVHVLENTFYADTAGSSIVQQRVRIHPEFTASVRSADGRLVSMRTLAPPVARGWEYLDGVGWDWAAELAELPSVLREHAAGETVEPGRYDLVIHPSNLWLTIHESIGHATEFDRIVGHEAAFAGTSFIDAKNIGSLRYGSELMNVRGDRVAEHGLATVGFDDQGVAAQEFDIVRGGVLVGAQLEREMAAASGARRSNGCAYADSYRHAALQRMPNVSLQAAPDGPSTEGLIDGVERGIYIVGDRSWSIDMQRLNFQFTGQRFYSIKNGQLAGPLRDVAYQSSTVEFWTSLTGVGGPETYALYGSIDCGKGQPRQAAPVSHGCPSALFRDVNVLNTSSS